MDFWSSYEYVMHYQSKDSHAQVMVMYSPPTIMLIVEPRMVIFH